MMNNRTAPRVLVIDHDKRVREDLLAIFKSPDYDTHVTPGSGHALLTNAINDAHAFRPHVAIVDLRLLLDDDPSDQSGLNLVRTLGPSRCILYSAYINPEISRQAAGFNTAGWVGKEERPQKLVDLVSKIALETCAYRKNFTIEKSSAVFDQIVGILLGANIRASTSLLEDILYQLFPTASSVTIETITSTVKTSASVSRGHSVVFKAKPKDRIEPLIVKLAAAKNILCEYQNYKKYIDGNLKGHFNAILRGEPLIFWDIGAILYSFLGSSDQKIIEFSAFYHRESDTDIILQPLKTFFSDVWRELYNKKEKDIKGSLFLSYDKTLHLQKRLKEFPDQTEYRAFKGIDSNLINPVSWVLRHHTESCIATSRQAITHGDLHGDNLFVDGTHAWAIDFERSGRGHILRDFVELEVDIITRLAWMKGQRNSEEFFRLAVDLAELRLPEAKYDPVNQFKDPEIRKAWRVISGLRNLAYETTRFSDLREYIWSLLFDSVFVATITTGGTPQSERAMLYASVLCSRFKHWGKEWPPEEWLPMLQSKPPTLSTSSDLPSLNPEKVEDSSSLPPRLQSPTGKGSTPIVNIVSAGALFVLGAVVVIALWWTMNHLDVTWQQQVGAYTFILIFAIIAFTLLRLVKGSAAVEALLKIFLVSLREKVFRPNSSDPKEKDNG